MPLKATDDFGTHSLIGSHHLPQLFGVELLRERSRAHYITEHHRQLAPLGLSRSVRRFSSLMLWGWSLRGWLCFCPETCRSGAPLLRFLLGRVLGPHQYFAALIRGYAL